MKKLLTILFVFTLFGAARAQLVVNSGLTPAQVVAGFMGSGLTVSNITLNCPTGASGTFSNGNTTNIGVTAGSIFTSGSAAGAIGPNNTGGYSVSNGTIVNDPNLTSIEAQAYRDPCILTFNVIPSCSTLTIRFVFGSEEYPEYVNASFNDAFGFFITGPNPSGPAYSGYNVARLPNGTQVSIDNVNAGLNAAYYITNSQNTIQYDAFTTVITSNLAVTPCSTYFFKIAIADAGDHIYDSGVFIDFLTCSTVLTTTSSSTPTCGCSGTATVNASGGQPAYTYIWNTTPAQNTSTATGLCPGSYVVTVYDQNGCVSNSNSSTIVVGSMAAGTASIASVNNVNCNGGNNGSATATITGGTSPYTYAWSPTGGNAATANNLGAGTYTVLVTDASGCSVTATVSITAASGPTVTAAASSTVTCNGGTNGNASSTVTGGTASFTYVWNTTPQQTTSNATGLGAGSYNVIVTDANGCTSIASVTIAQPQPLTATATAVNAKCNGGNTGSATATMNGGSAPYTYLWNNNQTSQTATGLSQGNYNVVITDANGCTALSSVSISQPQRPAGLRSAGIKNTSLSAKTKIIKSNEL